MLLKRNAPSVKQAEFNYKPSSQIHFVVSRNSEHESLIQNLLKKPFKSPLPNHVQSGSFSRNLGIRRVGVKTALHDPNDEHALILYSPEVKSAHNSFLECGKDSKNDVHVIVDPIISKVLRPHQREGVKFMYDCCTGLKSNENLPIVGCIMADEMGLGKTLQCVALAWTMLKQSPQITPPHVYKVTIVCPSSLVKNWQNEFNKWLGNRVSCTTIGEGGKEQVRKMLSDFACQQPPRIPNQVLVVSYETLRIHVDCIKNSNMGLMICDEGHRLKNFDNQTYQALFQLKTESRIILSGTPIQNDLGEFYSLMNFVNPDLMGSIASFRKNFENPILNSREPGCSEAVKSKGDDCLHKLLLITKECIIRRTQALLIKYLPVKQTYIVCCSLTMKQKEFYRETVEKFNKTTSNDTPLSTITKLKKICNHPDLIIDDANRKKQKSSKIEDSGKIKLLDMMLANIRNTTDDKVVLISNYTQTIDLFEELCAARKYKYVRLDGSLNIKKRQKLVNELNSPDSDIFAFMLSSKAGGCGLNLIGANRLFMFDPDWNPANDEQAMARVWRDGQKKICYVYRFVCSGTVEERMLQRQMHKLSLSDSIINQLDSKDKHENEQSEELKEEYGEIRFSSEDLKALFKYDFDTLSCIHDQMKCKRCVSNIQTLLPPDEATCNDTLVDWNHCFQAKNLATDPILRKCFSSDTIKMVFHQKSHEQISTI